MDKIAKNETERRVFPNLELRVDGSADKPKITGYAAVFDELSEDLGGWFERIRPGAFTKTLKEADVRALFNHNPNYVLGRNKANTLKLSEDNRGLAIEIDPPIEAQWAKDLIVSLKRGDVDQMSFAFQTVRDEWKSAGDKIIRDVIEVKLFDVSPVTFPAYPQTSAQVRWLEKPLLDAIQHLRNGSANELELRMLDALIARPENGAPGQEPHPPDEAGNAQERITMLRRRLELAEVN